MFRKLSNDEFNEHVEGIIIKFSLIFALVIALVFLIFGLRYTVSFLIGYGVSIIIFVKDNRIITNLLYKRMLYPSFWMIISNIVSYVFYAGVTLLFIFVPYLSLWGIVGLFMIEVATIVVGIIYS